MPWWRAMTTAIWGAEETPAITMVSVKMPFLVGNICSYLVVSDQRKSPSVPALGVVTRNPTANA